MLNFYRLDSSSKIMEVGCFPQSETLGCGYNHDNFNSAKFVKHFEIPDFTPDLGCIVLNDRAKITDLISSATVSVGLIVSSKFKNLLSAFALPNHKFFPVKIKYQDNLHENYFWFVYEKPDLLDYIDYNLTNFFISDIFGDYKRDISIKSKEEFLLEKQKCHYKERISGSSLFFSKSFPKIDLFIPPIKNYSIHVSSELHNTIKDEIKGVDLALANWLTFLA